MSGTSEGAKSRHLFANELRKALIQDNYSQLRQGIQALIAKAAEGEIKALEFIADRVDGKAAQSIALTGEDGGPIRVANLTDEQLANIAAGRSD
jgi:hypothetical protein